MLRLDMSRLVYALVSLLLVQLGFVFTFFSSDQNIYNLLSAGVGALVIRFAFPRLPWRVSVGGWFVGVALGMQFGRSVFNAHFLHDALEEQAVFGLVALTGDLIIQVVAFIVRLTSKLGNYAEQYPGEAFDEVLERGEKVATVWTRIQVPIGSLVDFVKQFFPKKT